MQKITAILPEIKATILQTQLTNADIDLLDKASSNGARPATDNVCQFCGDYGLRRATEDDLPFMKLDAQAEKYFRMGYIFNVPCEHCADKRRATFINEWQDKSRMTASEKEIRIRDIIVIGTNKGTAEVKRACEEMIRRESFMLTIQGTSGNAKSVALMAVVNEFLQKGTPALYITLTDALDWISEAFNSDSTIKEDETALKRYQMLEGVVMLAVDEMQDAKESDWTFKILASLVNRRQRNAVDGTTFTIFATNKPVDKLPAQIVSRLKDGRNRKDGHLPENSPIIVNTDADMRPKMKRKVKNG